MSRVRVLVDPKTLPPPPPGEETLSHNQMVQTQEMHCQCGRFLGYQAIIWGIVQVKCTNSKCKKWNTYDIMPDGKR